MLILKTIVHETIWGGSRLTPFSGTNSRKIGHLYSLISNGEFESAVLNGKYKGRLFREYFDENKDKFGLTEYKEFPFLLAIVDATEDLSLQVHPDDRTAKELEGVEFGKNEVMVWVHVRTYTPSCSIKRLVRSKRPTTHNKLHLTNFPVEGRPVKRS